MEALMATGDFTPPSLHSIEAALEYGLACGAGRVFVDLWDVEKFIGCAECSQARIERLRAMNATQVIPFSIKCNSCAPMVLS
jgi:hypothetical protein